jgi:hypothetical protein
MDEWARLARMPCSNFGLRGENYHININCHAQILSEPGINISNIYVNMSRTYNIKDNLHVSVKQRKLRRSRTSYSKNTTWEANFASGELAIFRELPAKVVQSFEKINKDQTYGQNSVIREEKCIRYNPPGDIPWNIFLIDKNAHEFWDSECRMGLLESLVSHPSIIQEYAVRH